MSKEIGLFGEEKKGLSLRQQANNYLRQWPIFLICVLLCVGAGVLYIIYTPPKYMAETKFMVKGEESGSASSEDLIESAIGGNQQVNLSNEILLVQSSTLMDRIVMKNGFNIFYFRKEGGMDVDIYKDAPFQIIKKEGSDKLSFKILVESITSEGGEYSAETKEKQQFKWNVPITIAGHTFVLMPKGKITADKATYVAEWVPVSIAAAELSANLVVEPLEDKASVIQIFLKTRNKQKGQDILDALFAEFNLSNMEERNELSDSTVSFINDRLIVVTDELKNVEGNLENFKESSRLVDATAQTQQSLSNASDVTKAIKNIKTQQGVTSMISRYIADPSNNNRMVPSSLGLDDPNLSSLLNRYNEAIINKEKEAPNVAPKSTVMQELNSQVANLKSSILENLNTVNNNLRLQEGNLAQQNRQYTGFLSSVPHNERAMQEIKRKQGITEGLYLYLLQKREEAAISRTSGKIAHYTQIDPARGYGPVDPNKQNIIMYTVLLGIFIASGIIYGKNLFNEKITSQDELNQLTEIPLLGTINFIPKFKEQTIAVANHSHIGEQFRALRTSVILLLKNKRCKKILVTSPGRGDGKSFSSLNLAVVCAQAGKKVALLDFDFRQPGMHKFFGLENSVGITGYLSGDVSNADTIFQEQSDVPGLHIYNAGNAGENPSDLLLSDRLPDFFNYLDGQSYDYIIIDAPSVGLVSDAVILSEYADLGLYVIRAGNTQKAQLDLINHSANSGQFAYTANLLNSVKTRKKQMSYLIK